MRLPNEAKRDIFRVKSAMSVEKVDEPLQLMIAHTAAGEALPRIHTKDFGVDFGHGSGGDAESVVEGPASGVDGPRGHLPILAVDRPKAFGGELGPNTTTSLVRTRIRTARFWPS